MAPPIRTDIVDVYVFRRARSETRHPESDLEFLQLHRVPTISLPDTWQPVMGHMHPEETPAATALRELAEETGYRPGAGLLGFWQLEEPNTYFLNSHHCFVMSPCFAAEVEPGRAPLLDADHDAARWVARPLADRAFLWPGQRRAVAATVRDILEPGSPVEPLLRIDVNTGQSKP